MRKSSDTPAFDRDRDGALVRDLRAAKLMRVREDAAEAGFGISNAVTKQFGLRGGRNGQTGTSAYTNNTTRNTDLVESALVVAKVAFAAGALVKHLPTHRAGSLK